AITIFLAEPPRTTASGLIVVADVNINDLLAFAIDGDTLHRQWIAHPGGPVVTYATAGDVTLASTAQRQLVAYDDNGVRLWQTAVPELVVAPPTATEDGRFVTVGLDGTVTLFDALTGEPAWSHGLGTDVERSAVVTGDTVTVIDRAGTMTALSLADGEVLWSHAGAPAMGLIALDTTLVVAGADGWVRAISAETGQLGHSWRYPGAWRALLNLGDVVVVASSEITLGLDPKTGRELWWGSGVESMVGDGVVAVALLDSTATAINARGERLAEWDVPESFAWSAQYVVATRDGILFMHSGSDATILGAR
ncbi:MAG TPA: PQQ-binding-like beta-propeller repeat protein, partial [Terrimesophilobacter sp.]|nr:PQQ-binding-like beta-propeller repeat protein [Terrimesophilobacter sp.]